jgi:hypothetical protein
MKAKTSRYATARQPEAKTLLDALPAHDLNIMKTV